MVFQQKPQILTVDDLLGDVYDQVVHSTKYRKFQRMYKNDRVAFAYDIFPGYRHSITEYQQEILSYFDEGYNRVSVRGPHGLGKTFLAALLTHHTVLTAEEDCKVVTTASAWRQLEKYLWPEIIKHSTKIDWSSVGRPAYDRNRELLKQSIYLNGGTVEAFAVSSDDHNTIEGAHATIMVYIYDEAKTIPRDTWNASEGAFSAEGLSDVHKALAFAISTPGPTSGQFYDIQTKKPGYEDWLVRHVTVDEAIAARRISASWVEQRKVQWGIDSAIFRNRVLGEFADSSEDSVIPYSWVMLAIARWNSWESSQFPELPGKRIIGADIARFGEDATVFADRHGSAITNIHKYPKVSVSDAARIAESLNHEHTYHIEMDGGLGAGVYDIMKDRKVQKLRAIHMSAPTHRRDRSGVYKFNSTRSAAWWNLRELMDPVYGEDIMLPEDEDLIADLTTPYWEEKEGKIVIETKKEVKKRLGRSTDTGDAVVLAYWNPSSGGGVVF